MVNRSFTSVGYGVCESEESKEESVNFESHVYYGRGFCRAQTMMETYSLNFIDEQIESLNIDSGEDCTVIDEQPENIVDIKIRHHSNEEEKEITMDGEEVDELEEAEQLEEVLLAQEDPQLLERHTSPILKSLTCMPITTTLSALKKPRVHKSLKDLINKTNKMIYDVDSNHVQFKAGLSRRSALPSLHPTNKTIFTE